MIQLVHTLPWDEPLWPLRLQTVPAEQIVTLADESTALCARSHYLPGCPLRHRLRVLAGESASSVLSEARKDGSEKLLAAFAADMSYALGNPEQAVALWTQYLSPSGLLARATVMLADGDYLVATELISIIDGKLKNASLRERHEMAVTLAQFATREVEEGNYSRAIRWWEEAIAHIDGRAQYYYGLGNALSHNMRWTEAVSAYNEAIRLEPNNPNHYTGLALVRLQQGNESAALEMARRALVLDPNNSIALRLLGRQ